jgi:ribosome biogenesis GTPase
VQLEMLGWNGFFAGQLASQVCPGVPGRVASAIRERFLVWTESGEVEAAISGRLRRSGSSWPAVGDWVALRSEAPIIDHVFARQTLLSRKHPGLAVHEQVLAANIDVLFIVSGLDRDFNERRIERYLVIAHQSGARPVILLNKADLAADYGIDLHQAVARLRLWSGVPVIPTCALTSWGEYVGAPGPGSSPTGLCSWGGGPAFETCEEINRLLWPGRTAALIGSSGVGKSTIVNRLLGESRQPANPVRPDDNRGRHTTTTRSMFIMPAGWFLIDMPGLREVQLWAAPEHLDASFEDVRELAAACRFRDCAHTTEPGCALRDAAIDQDRLANYQKMQRELDYLDRKADKRLMSETKARWKVMHKAMRNSSKEKW